MSGRAGPRTLADEALLVWLTVQPTACLVMGTMRALGEVVTAVAARGVQIPARDGGP